MRSANWQPIPTSRPNFHPHHQPVTCKFPLTGFHERAFGDQIGKVACRRRAGGTGDAETVCRAKPTDETIRPLPDHAQQTLFLPRGQCSPKTFQQPGLRHQEFDGRLPVFVFAVSSQGRSVIFNRPCFRPALKARGPPRREGKRNCRGISQVESWDLGEESHMSDSSDTGKGRNDSGTGP